MVPMRATRIGRRAGQRSRVELGDKVSPKCLGTCVMSHFGNRGGDNWLRAEMAPNFADQWHCAQVDYCIVLNKILEHCSSPGPGAELNPRYGFEGPEDIYE